MILNEEKAKLLYEKNYKNILLLIKLRIKDEQQSLDILHDAYISVFNNIDKINDEDHFTKYLTKTAINKCIDYQKKRKLILFADSRDEDYDLEDFIEDNHNIDIQPEKNFEYNELKNALMSIIESLPDDQKTCLLLFYYKQYSITEISDILDINENTVKSRLNYGKKKIKAEIERLDKNGVKLFSYSPSILLFWLFKNQTEYIPSPTSQISINKFGDVHIQKSSSSKLFKLNNFANTAIKKYFIIPFIIIGSIATIVITTNSISNPHIQLDRQEQTHPIIDQSTPNSLLNSFISCLKHNDIEKASSLFIYQYSTSAYIDMKTDVETDIEKCNYKSSKECIDHSLSQLDINKINRATIETELYADENLHLYLINLNDSKDPKFAITHMIHKDNKYWLVAYTRYTLPSEISDQIHSNNYSYFPFTDFVYFVIEEK